MPTADVFCVFAGEAGAGVLAFLPFVSVKEGGRRFFEVGTAIALASLVLGHAVRALAGGYSSFDTTRLLGLILATGAVVLAVVAVKVLRGKEFMGAVPWLRAASVLALAALVPEGIVADRSSPVPTPAHALAIASVLCGALLLGSVVLAMTLGHFYLVIPRLSIDPLRRLTNGYLGSVIGRTAIALVALALSWSVFGKDDRLLLEQAMVLLPRVLFGIAGAALLAVLARGTVAIKSTQSATGILYGATVLVVVGELSASYLLVEAGLPL